MRVKDRFLRGIYYSAARSFLYNRILSARVAQHSWNTALSGDVMQLSGKHSIFSIDIPDDTIHSRVVAQDLSPASPLWGKGNELATMDALAVQHDALSGFKPWCTSLEEHGLERSYRAHRLCVQDLTWVWDDGALVLSFALTAGGYATSVLRELMEGVA